MVRLLLIFGLLVPSLGLAQQSSTAPVVGVQSHTSNPSSFPLSSGTSNFVIAGVPNTNSPSISNSINARANSEPACENRKYGSPVRGAFWGAFFAALLALTAGAIKFWFKRSLLTCRLKVFADLPHGNHFRCGVFNGGSLPVRNAAIYISLDCIKDDTCKPPDGHDAIIRPDHFVPLKEGQLCWSTRSSAAMYPTKTDIYAKECQGFSPFAFTNPKDMLMVPSEEGWPRFKDEPLKMRIFLKPKPYKGYLKIVSEDTNAKCYKITINPADTGNPIQLQRVKNACCKRVSPNLPRLCDSKTKH